MISFRQIATSIAKTQLLFIILIINSTNDTRILSNVWSGQISGKEDTSFSEPILITFTVEKVSKILPLDLHLSFIIYLLLFIIYYLFIIIYHLLFIYYYLFIIIYQINNETHNYVCSYWNTT